MSEMKIKPGWQPVQEVNWEAFEQAIQGCKTKQQIITHLQNLFENKGYANMIRAAKIAFDKLTDVTTGEKGSIGVHTMVDGKEIYTNFRFQETSGKSKNDEFNY
jgi:hypothetical protein